MKKKEKIYKLRLMEIQVDDEVAKESVNKFSEVYLRDYHFNEGGNYHWGKITTEFLGEQVKSLFGALKRTEDNL